MHLPPSRSGVSYSSFQYTSRTGLKILRLSGNRLKQLPESVDILTGCVELDVSKNMLTTLPSTILTLQLQTLSVASNNIAALPEKIGRLKSLISLVRWKALSPPPPPPLSRARALSLSRLLSLSLSLSLSRLLSLCLCLSSSICFHAQLLDS